MSTEKPALSVIVCTRDRPRNLRRCLPSVLASLEQLEAGAEIIVVDSSDAPSGEVAEAARQAGASCFWEPHRGVSPARNRGILESRSEILAFLDDDVTVDRGWAAALLRHFANPDVGAVTGALHSGDSGEEPADVAWQDLYGKASSEATVFQKDSPYPFFPVTAGLCGVSANMAFRKSSLLRHGLFDVNLGTGTLAPGNEEVDRFYALLRSGKRIVYDPQAKAWHRFEGSRGKLWRRVAGYAAGQSGYLGKLLVTDPVARRVVLRFVVARARAVLGGHVPDQELGPARARRIPLVAGTLWGPLGYFLGVIIERFRPARNVQVPRSGREQDAGQVRILASLYNSGLTGPEKLAAMIARSAVPAFTTLVLMPGPGPAAEQLHGLGVRVGFVPHWRLRATLNPLYQLCYLLALPGAARAFRQAVTEFRPDVVHVHSVVNLGALLGSRLARRPVLLHMHEIPSGPLGRVLCRLAAALSHRIVAVSHAAASGFSASVKGSKLFVVHNGVEPENPTTFGGPQAQAADPGGGVTFVGRLSEDKGADLFIQAAGLVYREMPSATFLICGLTVPGRRSYERRLERLLAQSPVPASQLRVLKDRVDVADFIQASHIIVSCSPVPDPCPLALLEAMALGKAVVAPSVGGIPELVRDGETGLLYQPGDLEQLSRLLVRLLQNPDYAQSLGRAGRDRVLTELNATRMSNEIARHYSELANALPAGSVDAESVLN